MAQLKTKGDLAELKVATDLLFRGFRIALPFGEDCDYDLICDTGVALHRIQVKYTQSDGRVVAVRCRSNSLTKGKVMQVKHYTSASVDWIAVYDSTSDACYYVPAVELGNGRDLIHLRLEQPLNNQRIGIRFATDYQAFPEPKTRPLDMEPAGLEPAPSALQTPRSSN
jgi:PD-(D/E)XK endonuclease